MHLKHKMYDQSYKLRNRMKTKVENRRVNKILSKIMVSDTTKNYKQKNRKLKS